MAESTIKRNETYITTPTGKTPVVIIAHDDLSDAEKNVFHSMNHSDAVSYARLRGWNLTIDNN